MLSKCLNWLSKRIWLLIEILFNWFRETALPKLEPKIKELIILAKPPWNLPLLVGLGFVGLGLLLILTSFKSDWYSIPIHMDPAPIVDQTNVLPTKRIPRTMVATTKKSRFQYPFQAILVLAFVCAGVHIVRHRFQAFPRAQALGQFAAICFATGLTFAHLVIVDEPELSHIAAWTWSQHDGLAWYGGDIYTSREYEVPGGALDISMKDPPKFLSVVCPPYIDLDLATINDFLTWAGLCFAFWVFLGKGWATMMLGSLLLMVGVLCTREPNQTRGLSNKIVVWVMIRAVMIVVPWIVFVTGRSLVVAHTVQNAQTAYLQGDYQQSLEHMSWYRKLMPCLAFDSALMLQEGILEHELEIPSDRAEFARAFHMETDGFPEQAEAAYLRLMDSKYEPVAREAVRNLFRRAIIRYNDGEESVSLEYLKIFQLKYPCMPKACYLRLLIAVRENDFTTAQQSLQEIYCIVRTIGIPEARGYCTSGHQHLAQLAFDMNDVPEIRRQSIFRAEQQPK